MLGSKSGVAQQILALQPKALATHCHGHSLSLSVMDTVRNCTLLSDTMDTAKEIVTLIKYSPKTENILGEVKENIEQQDENSDAETSTGGILQLCTTRWTVRAACFKRILDNYEALFGVWEISLGQKLDPDVKG